MSASSSGCTAFQFEDEEISSLVQRVDVSLRLDGTLLEDRHQARVFKQDVEDICGDEVLEMLLPLAEVREVAEGNRLEAVEYP